MPRKHQHQPDKFYLTTPFEEFPVRFGTHSHPTPRHMTIVPWFRTRRVGELLEAIQGYCLDQQPFDVTFGRPESFGPTGELQAQRVVQNRHEVVCMHSGLLAVVSSMAEIIDLSYAGDQYTPHSSIEGHAEFKEGELVNVRSVLLIAKYVEDEHRINDPDKEHSSGFRLGAKPEDSA